MSGFYNLTYTATDEDLLTVVEFDLAGYDHMLLWNGRRVAGPPRDAVLTVSGNDCDLVRNSISWQIMSWRFLDLITQIASADLQVFPAPLLSLATSEDVEGYYVVNCVRRVPCLDRAHSRYEIDDEFPDELVVYDLAVDASRVPTNVHVFRVDEYPYAGLIFSESVVSQLVGQNLRGVAFVRC